MKKSIQIILTCVLIISLITGSAGMNTIASEQVPADCTTVLPDKEEIDANIIEEIQPEDPEDILPEDHEEAKPEEIKPEETAPADGKAELMDSATCVVDVTQGDYSLNQPGSKAFYKVSGSTKENTITIEGGTSGDPVLVNLESGLKMDLHNGSDDNAAKDSPIPMKMSEPGSARNTSGTSAGNSGGTSSGRTTPAKTGDESNPVLWMLVLAAAAAAMISILRRKK